MGGPLWAIRLEPIDGVELWISMLDQPPEVYRSCKQCLSDTELVRFTKVGDHNVADAFVIRRGTLRYVVGNALGIDASECEILSPPDKKPHLADHRLEFNVSSSKGVALFALSKSNAVGVDIEWIDTEFDFIGDLADSFSFGERQKLLDASPDRLFDAWCRKEACAKLLGDGIASPMNQLIVVDASFVHFGQITMCVRSLDGLPAGYSAAMAWSPLP